MFDIEYYVNPDLESMINVYEKMKKKSLADSGDKPPENKSEKKDVVTNTNRKSFDQSLNEYKKQVREK